MSYCVIIHHATSHNICTRHHIALNHITHLDSPGIILGSLELTWTHLNSLGLAWSHLDSPGLNWTHLGSHGLTWGLLDSPGKESWGGLSHSDSLSLNGSHLDSLDLTWSHLDLFSRRVSIFPYLNIRSLYRTIYLCVCLSACLPVCLFVCLSMNPTILSMKQDPPDTPTCIG